jgi:hypothetical protein
MTCEMSQSHMGRAFLKGWTHGAPGLLLGVFWPFGVYSMAHVIIVLDMGIYRIISSN